MTSKELFDELRTARAMLTASPVARSLDQVYLPLSRAVEILRNSTGLTSAERECLLRELSGVGQLLEGVGHWLAAGGAITPTYNRRAEFDTGRVGGSLAVEG